MFLLLDKEGLREAGEGAYLRCRRGWTDARPSQWRQSGDRLAGRASNLGERRVYSWMVDADEHVDVRVLSHRRKRDCLEMPPLRSVHLPVHRLQVAGDTISGCRVKLAAKR